jgi:hypothetical protein
MGDHSSQASMQFALMSRDRVHEVNDQLNEAKQLFDLQKLQTDLVQSEKCLFPEELCTLNSAQSARALHRHHGFDFQHAQPQF